MSKKPPARGPAPPAPRQGRRSAPPVMSKPDPAETRRHAEEIRGQAKGRDTVESRARAQDAAEREGKPAAFDGEDLLVVRSWLKRRPLETAPAAAALIQYPRMWTTKRGRYCKFKAPGAGVYGLLRARPTF